MKCLNHTAPYIDQLVKYAQADPIVKDKKSADKLLDLIRDICLLEIQGDDERRSIWIEAERGKIGDFGSYEEYLEEEVVRDYKEFVELWEYYYPDEKKWYNFTYLTYSNEYYLFLDSELTFHIPDMEGLENTDPPNIELIEELIEWLSEKVKDTISRIKKDMPGFNKYISKNLSYQRKYGRIPRNEYWKIFPEEGQILKEAFTDESIAILEKIAEQSAEDKTVLGTRKVSAGDFFRFCEICYDANEYFKGKEKQTPREKYIAMADGRDCGLTKLDVESESAFAKWYKNDSNCGGHPWEICRGGNSTHISLYLYQVENYWKLRLAGCSQGRAIETVKMALALYKNNIPFDLEKAEEILKMIKGIDFIGIVPEKIIPVYCHGSFPDEDKINYFMNLGFERIGEIIKKSYWYPIEQVRLKGSTPVS